MGGHSAVPGAGLGLWAQTQHITVGGCSLGPQTACLSELSWQHEGTGLGDQDHLWRQATYLPDSRQKSIVGISRNLSSGDTEHFPESREGKSRQRAWFQQGAGGGGAGRCLTHAGGYTQLSPTTRLSQLCLCCCCCSLHLPVPPRPPGSGEMVSRPIHASHCEPGSAGLFPPLQIGSGPERNLDFS